MRPRTIDTLSRSLRLRRRTIDAALLENGDAELILLREENARLKAERHRVPNMDTLVETVRGIAAASAVAENKGDDAWDVLTEAMVMREILMDVCREMERCMLALQHRLRPLEPGTLLSATAHNAGNGNRNGNGNGDVPLHDAAQSNCQISLHVGPPALAEGAHEDWPGD